jgi:hypothetical protein
MKYSASGCTVAQLDTTVVTRVVLDSVVEGTVVEGSVVEGSVVAKTAKVVAKTAEATQADNAAMFCFLISYNTSYLCCLRH